MPFPFSLDKNGFTVVKHASSLSYLPEDGVAWITRNLLEEIYYPKISTLPRQCHWSEEDDGPRW